MLPIMGAHTDTGTAEIKTREGETKEEVVVARIKAPATVLCTENLGSSAMRATNGVEVLGQMGNV